MQRNQSVHQIRLIFFWFLWVVHSMMRQVPRLPLLTGTITILCEAFVENVLHKGAIIFVHFPVCLKLLLEAEYTFDG